MEIKIEDGSYNTNFGGRVDNNQLYTVYAMRGILREEVFPRRESLSSVTTVVLCKRLQKLDSEGILHMLT